jgi:hypothetical protein
LPDCPLTPEALPPNFRKHVEANSPKPLRGMAAKGLVPMAPSQNATALFMLSFDAEADIAEQARKTAAGLPERILGTALRDPELHPAVLDFFAEVLAGKDNFLEILCLNPSTSDETLAKLALIASAKIADIIAQNQLRLLRHEPLLRALFQNGNAPQSTLDSVGDFAVRSGVNLPDVPALVEARRRVFGEEAAAVAPEAGPSAEEVAKEFAVEADTAAPLEDGKRLTFTQKILRMNVSEKIKLAARGNKECRTLLLRDSNKLVAMSAIQNPRITDQEVLALANNRTALGDIINYISNNREWLKNYSVKLALVKNPKVPLPTAMRFLPLLREADIKAIGDDKNVPSGVKNQAKAMMSKKNAPKESGGGH